MESPKESYKYMSSILGIEKIAHDVLFEKYIIQNRKGQDKLDNIEDTDQESLLLKLNGGYPVIGLIYTFIYKPSIEEINTIKSGKKPEKYTDHVPLIFCTGYKDNMITGINLNVLPLSERLNFLQLYYETYKEFFKDIERSTQNNKLAINKKFISLALGGERKKFIKMWSDSLGSNFSYGYKSYNIKKIENLRCIEFVEWQYIPFFVSDNAVKMMNINRIHNLYWKNL